MYIFNIYYNAYIAVEIMKTPTKLTRKSFIKKLQCELCCLQADEILGSSSFLNYSMGGDTIDHLLSHNIAMPHHNSNLETSSLSTPQKLHGQTQVSAQSIIHQVGSNNGFNIINQQAQSSSKHQSCSSVASSASHQQQQSIMQQQTLLMPQSHAPAPGPSSQTPIFNVKPGSNGSQKQGNNNQKLLSSGSSKNLSNSKLNSSNVSTYMNNSMSSMQSLSQDISNISSGGDLSSLLNITNSNINSVNNIGGVQILNGQNQQSNQLIANHSSQSQFLSATNSFGGAANNQSLSSLMSANGQMIQTNQIIAQNPNVIGQEFQPTIQIQNNNQNQQYIVATSGTGVVQSSQHFQQPKISTSTPKTGKRSSGGGGGSTNSRAVAASSISAINSSRASQLSSQPSIIVSSVNNQNLAVSNGSLMLPMVLSSGSQSNNILKPMMPNNTGIFQLFNNKLANVVSSATPRMIQPKPPQLLPKPMNAGLPNVVSQQLVNNLSAKSAALPASKTIITNSQSSAIISNASGSNIAEVQNHNPILLNNLANQQVFSGQTMLQNNAGNGNSIILSNGNILQTSGLQGGLQQPILINHNGVQLIVRPTGAQTNPFIMNSTPQFVLNGQQTGANATVNNATAAKSTPVPTPQPPAQAFVINGQTYVMPQLGSQNIATSSAPRSIAPSQAPVLRFISPQQPQTILQQINTPNGPSYIALQVPQNQQLGGQSVRPTLQLGPQPTLQLGPQMLPTLAANGSNGLTLQQAAAPAAITKATKETATIAKTASIATVNNASSSNPQLILQEATNQSKKKKNPKKKKEPKETPTKAKSSSMSLSDIMKQSGIMDMFDDGELGSLGDDTLEHESVSLNNAPSPSSNTIVLSSGNSNQHNVETLNPAPNSFASPSPSFQVISSVNSSMANSFQQSGQSFLNSAGGVSNITSDAIAPFMTENNLSQAKSSFGGNILSSNVLNMGGAGASNVLNMGGAGASNVLNMGGAGLKLPNSAGQGNLVLTHDANGKLVLSTMQPQIVSQPQPQQHQFISTVSSVLSTFKLCFK